MNGEWQRLRFESPRFAVSPSITAAYAEAKSILTPRFFVAGRAGWLSPRRVVDLSGAAADQFALTLTSVETGAGVWVSRRMLLKGSYSILHSTGSGRKNNVLGFQVVSSFRVDKAFQ